MSQLFVYFCAALVLAVTPGPGILYVMARSVANGRRDGLRSCFGTFLGGLVHVIAAGLGLSAILSTSVVAFSIIKYAGAAYLIYLGIRMIVTRNEISSPATQETARSQYPVVQGFITEALNPKTALFFLSFVPQFVTKASGNVFWQFLALGTVSVLLNTLVDIVVVIFATPLGRISIRSEYFHRRQRTASGLLMIGLGIYVALSNSRSSSARPSRFWGQRPLGLSVISLS